MQERNNVGGPYQLQQPQSNNNPPPKRFERQRSTSSNISHRVPSRSSLGGSNRVGQEPGMANNSSNKLKTSNENDLISRRGSKTINRPKSTISKASVGSERIREGAAQRIEGTVFLFINALKLEKPIPRFIYFLLNIIVIWQTLSLGVSIDFNWGEYGRYLYHAIAIPRTFGFQFLPYDAFIGLAIAVYILEIIALFTIYLTYRSFINGSKYWSKIKTTARITFALMIIISLPSTYGMSSSFWDCDYAQTVNMSGRATFVLKRFPSVECWGASNGALAAISIVAMIVQIFFTTFALFIFCDTGMSSKSLFAMENSILLAVVVATNQIFLIISQVTPSMVYYLRPIYFIIFSFITLVVLVWQTPFLYRFMNSIYGGITAGRIGIAVGSLIATIINKEDDWQVGLGLTFGPFGGFIIFFIIGFVGVEIYTRVLKSRGRKLLEGLIESRNIAVLMDKDYYYITQFIRYSNKATEKEKTLGKCFSRMVVNYKDAIPSETLLAIALFMKYVLEDNSTTFILMLLKKAEKQRNDFLTRFKLFLRFREIERATSTGRNNFELDHILEGIQKKTDLLKHLQVRFWKNVSTGQDLYSVTKQMEETSTECYQTFGNLMVNNHNNKTVLRAYASYLEEFAFEPLVAEELYNEANILEEEEVLKSKPKSKKPVATAHPEPSKLFVTYIEDDDVLESASQQGEMDPGERLKEQYRSAINKREDNNFILIFLVSLCVVSIVYMIITLAMDLAFTNKNTGVVEVIKEACILGPIPYALLSDIRRINLLDDEKLVENSTIFFDYHQQRLDSFKSVLETFIHSSEGVGFSIKMKQDFTNNDKTYNVAITKLENVTGIDYYSKKASISTIANAFSSLTNEISLFNKTTYSETYTNFYFSMMFVNRFSFTNAFENFYSSMITDELTDLQYDTSVFVIVFATLTAAYFVYILVYLGMLISHVNHRKHILKLFSNIQKHESSKICHELELRTDNTIIPQKNYFITPVRGIIILLSLALSITTIASALILYEGLTQMNSSILVMRKLEYSSKALMTSQRILFKIQELLLEDATVLGVNKTQFYQEIDAHLLDFEQGWTALRYGTEDDSFSSLAGVTDVIDNLLHSNCTSSNSTESFEDVCFGLDTVVDDFDNGVLKLNQNAYRGTFSRSILLSNLQTIYDESETLFNSFSTIMNSYVSHFANQQKVIGAVSTSLASFFLLVTVFLLYRAISSFGSENHQLRIMFNHLPVDILDSDDEIRSYILYYTLGNSKKKSEKNGQQVSNEKAILEAAVAGTAVCSSYGSIDIFNESAQKMFGYRLDEVIGVSLTHMFTNESKAPLQSVLSNMAVSSKTYGENLTLQGQRKNKSSFPVQLRISVSVIEGRNIISCFMTDLTSDKEHDLMLAEEKKKSESLLLNILPESIAHRLSNGETFIADSHEDVTCLFSDLVGFVEVSVNMSATELVQTLNIIINGFDALVPIYQIEKIKTISEKYFCAGGLKVRSDEGDNPEERTLKFAMDMFGVVYNYNTDFHRNFTVRIGMHCGPLVAGVCGTLKFAYDLWGDAVNTASRMESTGKSGRIQITEKLHSKLCVKYNFEQSSVVAKGKGEMITYLLSTEYYQNTSPDAMPLDSTLKIRARAMGHPISDEFSEQQSENGLQMDANEEYKPATPPPSSQISLNPVLATITKVSSLSSLTAAEEKEEKNSNTDQTLANNTGVDNAGSTNPTNTGLDSILKRSRSLSMKVQQPVLLDLKGSDNNNSGNLRRFSLPRPGSPGSPMGSDTRNPFSPGQNSSSSGNLLSNNTLNSNAIISNTLPVSVITLNQNMEVLQPSPRGSDSNSKASGSRRASVSSEESSSSGTLEVMSKPVLSANVRKSIEKQRVYDQETHRLSEYDSDDEKKSVLEVHTLRKPQQPYVNMDHHHRQENHNSVSEKHAPLKEEK